MLDKIKAILSPAGAWLWAELGNNGLKTVGSPGLPVQILAWGGILAHD